MNSKMSVRVTSVDLLLAAHCTTMRDMAMGKRKRDRQPAFGVGTPRGAAEVSIQGNRSTTFGTRRQAVN